MFFGCHTEFLEPPPQGQNCNNCQLPKKKPNQSTLARGPRVTIPRILCSFPFLLWAVFALMTLLVMHFDFHENKTTPENRPQQGLFISPLSRGKVQFAYSRSRMREILISQRTKLAVNSRRDTVPAAGKMCIIIIIVLLLL